MKCDLFNDEFTIETDEVMSYQWKMFLEEENMQKKVNEHFRFSAIRSLVSR